MIYRMCFHSSRVIQTLGFLSVFTLFVESTPDFRFDKIYNETCTQQFTPCACDTQQNGDLSVFCFYVPNDEIYDVFNRASAIQVSMRQLAIAFGYNEPNVSYTDDFLGSSKAESIIIISSYPNETRYIKIEKNAFKESGNTTSFLSLVGFNVAELDWDFLQVFRSPFQLSLSSLFNVNSLLSLPAWSPSLQSLVITYSTGLYDMPEVSGSLVEARFDWCNLNETSAMNIFQRMQNASKSLQTISLSGSPMIYRVPDDLKRFSYVQSLYLNENSIQELKAGEVFSDVGFRILDLSRNNIITIESGAFRKGDYKNADVYLNQNPFTTFEASVFQPMLEDMASLMNGTLHLNETNLICGCDMEWLVKYNPHLLGPVSTARCGNSTLFTALKPSGFNYCNHANTMVPKFLSKITLLVTIVTSVLLHL